MINIEVASKHYGYGLKFYTPKGGKDYLYINDGALKISYTLTNNKILILNKEKTISIPESEFMVILDKYKASIPVELYPKLIEIYQTSDTKRLTPKVEFNEDESIKHIQGKIGYGLKNEFYYDLDPNSLTYENFEKFQQSLGIQSSGIMSFKNNTNIPYEELKQHILEYSNINPQLLDEFFDNLPRQELTTSQLSKIDFSKFDFSKLRKFKEF